MNTIVQAGQRVGAICGSTADGGIDFYGYGVYVGEEVLPPGTQTPFGAVKDDDPPMKNPKIVLDSGDVVWGCQCWWGSEANVQEMLTDKAVTVVPVPVVDRPGFEV